MVLVFAMVPINFEIWGEGGKLIKSITQKSVPSNELADCGFKDSALGNDDSLILFCSSNFDSESIMTMCLGQKPCEQSQSQVSGPRVTNFRLTRAQSRPSTNIRGVSQTTATCGDVHRGLGRVVQPYIFSA